MQQSTARQLGYHDTNHTAACRAQKPPAWMLSDVSGTRVDGQCTPAGHAAAVRGRRLRAGPWPQRHARTAGAACFPAQSRPAHVYHWLLLLQYCSRAGPASSAIVSWTHSCERVRERVKVGSGLLHASRSTILCRDNKQHVGRAKQFYTCVTMATARARCRRVAISAAPKAPQMHTTAQPASTMPK